MAAGKVSASSQKRPIGGSHLCRACWHCGTYKLFFSFQTAEIASLEAFSLHHKEQRDSQLQNVQCGIRSVGSGRNVSCIAPVVCQNVQICAVNGRHDCLSSFLGDKSCLVSSTDIMVVIARMSQVPV